MKLGVNRSGLLIGCTDVGKIAAVSGRYAVSVGDLLRCRPEKRRRLYRRAVGGGGFLKEQGSRLCGFFVGRWRCL